MLPRFWSAAVRWFYSNPSRVQRYALERHRYMDAWVKSKMQGLVLDVGSGIGWLAKLADVGIQYVGVDVNLRAFRGAMNTLDGSRCHFVLCDAANLPFISQSFACVICLEVIEHLEAGEDVRAAEEFSRVLKADGVLLLSTPYDFLAAKFSDPYLFLETHRHYKTTDLRNMLSHVGFTVQAEDYARQGVIRTVLWFLFKPLEWVIAVTRSRVLRAAYQFISKHDPETVISGIRMLCIKSSRNEQHSINRAC